MNSTVKYLSLFLCILGNLISSSSLANPIIEMKTYKYTFTKEDDFLVSFADYPKDQENFYELQSENGSTLPPEIITTTAGLKISGNNHSDDLFMFAYKKLQGLQPNTTYHASFSLEFASNVSDDSFGSGGSPGSSVYMKIGAVNQEPSRYLDTNEHYKMTLDKGNQELDGKDMILIGNVSVDTSDSRYRLKTLPFQPTTDMEEKLKHYTVTSNGKGEIWIIFGTDSGFESTSTLFYTNLVVTLK